MFFKKRKQEKYGAFMTGKLMPLEQVKDPVFSSKQIGEGFAIEPTSGELYAPCDGQIMTVFPTGHAYGIRQKNGREVLLHLGIDTVELKGTGFTSLVKEGQEVKAGELLAKMALELVKENGKMTTTMMIFTTGENVKLDHFGEVKAKETLAIQVK